jgi:molybdopterin-containing oxidoreductase family iron-sulfur binding subunit
MGMDRRNFIRLTGLASLSGLGLNNSVNAEESNSGDTKRLALIIDMQKCRTQKDCKDCIAACHNVHNVPEIKENQMDLERVLRTCISDTKS